MRNVYWLRPRIIAGRTGPNQDPWDVIDLARGGIGAVLSVNDGAQVAPEELADADIHHLCTPLSDSAPPRPGDLEICTAALPAALRFATDAIDAGRSVLVHCQAGKDRTGMFLSYYLCAVEGLRPEAAIDELRRVRPTALSAPGWESFTLQVLRALEA